MTAPVPLPPPVRAIGPHRVVHGPIQDPRLDRVLAALPGRAQILYSDPPWGDGNLRYWTTIAHRHDGLREPDTAPLSYEALLLRLREIVDRYVHGFVMIETGIQWVDDVVRVVYGGLSVPFILPVKYRSGSKWLRNALLIGRNDGGAVTRAAWEPLRDGTGLALVRAAVRIAGAGTGYRVLDPCCGMGYTARAAAEAGATFIGNELNAARLDKTVRALVRLTPGVTAATPCP